MNESSIADYITQTFSGVETLAAYGYTFFCYRSGHKMPFATLIAQDTEYDRISNLNRPGVYRLNIGVSKPTFQTLFGAEKVDTSRYDFTALDILMPHPEYAEQNFICVLSPGEATLEQTRTFLAEAYEIATRRYQRQHKSN